MGERIERVITGSGSTDAKKARYWRVRSVSDPLPLSDTEIVL